MDNWKKVPELIMKIIDSFLLFNTNVLFFFTECGHGGDSEREWRTKETTEAI